MLCKRDKPYNIISSISNRTRVPDMHTEVLHRAGMGAGGGAEGIGHRAHVEPKTLEP